MAKTLRVVPRQPGDVTPLDPIVADALRKAGMDPANFTTAPESGEADTLAVEGLPAAGSHLTHKFHFVHLNDAFTAIERIIDSDVQARISKLVDGWLITFDAREDAAVDDKVEHERFAKMATDLGGTDRGYLRETVSVSVKRLNSETDRVALY